MSKKSFTSEDAMKATEEFYKIYNDPQNIDLFNSSKEGDLWLEKFHNNAVAMKKEIPDKK